MKTLPTHKLGFVLAIYGTTALLYVVLAFMGRNDNRNKESFDPSQLPYADIVAVEPGSELFFSWGVTASPLMKEIARSSVENRYGNTYQQSYSVLSQLTSDLAEVGLSLRDVVNVRAYIVADPEPDFDAWNQAFSEFFGTIENPNKPARTSLGITRLFHSDYRVEVEFTAVFPDDRGPHVPGTRQHERYERLGRIETSEKWKSYGRPIWPMSTGKATSANTGYFFSSSLRPLSLLPNAPPGFHMYGTTAQQSASLFTQMSTQLKEAGLDFSDVFFIRACVYPGAQSIAKSFATFNQEYTKHFNNSKNPNRPTRTVMSTPGFNYRKQELSIEYYAAYPGEDPGLFKNTKLKIGSTPAVSSQGVLGPAGTQVSPDAQLLFVSGSISSEPGDLETEALSALSILQKRLQLKDATLDDCVHLRVYFASADDKTLDTRIATWERIYRETFSEDSAPAITLLPIVSLPNERLIEIEAMAAIR